MAFSISLIIILGLAADYIFRKMKLPGLVGMLVTGILVGPYVLSLVRPEMMAVSADFRMIALIVILLRAGFELSRDTLNRVGRAALTMSAIPAIFEIIGVTLIAPKLLNITYLEAAILGAILGAVSPAVVVPLMINFMDRGKGTKKGIPTLIIGASSVDDVFVIVVFTILLGMYGGENINLFKKLTEIPISLALGILLGITPGYILYWLFNRYDWQPPKRTILVMGVAIFLTWVEKALEHWVPVASLLGVMAIGFIILEKSEPIAHVISQNLKKLWVFAELLLFVLVGAQVNIQVAWQAGIAGSIVIFVGLIFRSIGTYVSLFGTPLTFKEKLFCIVSYIPKATVQAAIGSVPLAAGVAGGEVILAVAVLSILITAPLGAIGIQMMGEKILETEERTEFKFRDLRERQGLPRVGERLLNKQNKTVWKVIEEKEIWIKNFSADAPTASDISTTASAAQTDQSRAQNQAEKISAPTIPAIILRLWQEGTSAGPGTGKTETRRYSPLDPPFNEQWEILYDW